jgi:glutaredoxin
MMLRTGLLRSALLAIALVGIGACSGEIDPVALRAEVGNAPVVLLSTSSCGYCRKLRSDLRDWGVAFDDIDVEKSSKGRDAYHRVGGRGVPILLIKGQPVHGYAPGRARTRLAEAGLIPAAKSK